MGTVFTSREQSMPVQLASPNGMGSAAMADSPVLTSENERSLFSDRPLDTVLNVKPCSHCQRPVIDKYLSAHEAECARELEERASRKRARSARNAAGELESAASSRAATPTPKAAAAANARSAMASTSTTPATAAATPTSSANPRKRKAQPSAPRSKATASKKRASDASSPASQSKAKLPVDLDKQCGVQLPNGQLCTRSLTCKSHNMSAKRAVPNRSQTFDMLLMQYQRKNQAKLQKQALKAVAMSEMEEPPSGAVDSDEEVALVMDAVAHTAARPLERRSMVPVRRRHSFFRIREMLSGALVRPNNAMQQVGGIMGRVIPFKVIVPEEHQGK